MARSILVNRHIILAWFPILLLAACEKRATSSVATYLTGAEIQAETDEQRASIETALNDMMTLAPDQLKNARYGSEQKTLPVLIRTHIVPVGPVPVEDGDFFTQAQDPQVRAAVDALRGKLKASGGGSKKEKF